MYEADKMGLIYISVDTINSIRKLLGKEELMKD